MAVKRTGQLSFAEAFAAPRAGANACLDRLEALVAWDRFAAPVAHVRDEAAPGRPGWPVRLMLKALILGALYGLSDRDLETALNDRLSFRRFVGLGLDQDAPDHTALNRFRNRLVAEGLLAPLFAELDRQLEAAGLILKRGTMLDATLIDTAAAAPPGPGRTPTDPDARYVRRAGRSGYVYGYKAHVGVDEGSGLVRAVVTTPANVTDTTPADALLRGDERVVWGDGAYHTHRRQAALKAQGVKPRLMRRANKHRPELPPRLKRYNRLIARHRAAVETTFATWKRRMGLRAIRYRGLVKASGQVLLVCLAFNLRRWAALRPA